MQAAKVDKAAWRAWLKLGFTRNATRTVLKEKQHQGPLIVQKPFYPEGDICHVYLIHPPGGVVGGDEINLEVEVQQDAHALITTPAANKFYFSAGDEARVTQNLQVAKGAILEWLPQENIFFNGSLARVITKVRLEQGAAFIGCESSCLGRPHADEQYTRGHLRQHFELWLEQTPLIIDRSTMQGGSDMLHEPWGLDGQTVFGSLLAYPADKALRERVREITADAESTRDSTTLIDGVLLYRVTSADAERLRQQLQTVWAAIRQSITGREACAPRIWFT